MRDRFPPPQNSTVCPRRFLRRFLEIYGDVPPEKRSRNKSKFDLMVARIFSFFSRPRPIMGIDLGAHTIRAVIGSVQPGQPIHIMGVGTAPSGGIRNGDVVDIAEATKAIADAYHMACQAARAKPAEVLIGISGDHIHGVHLEAVVDVANPAKGIDKRDCRRARNRALTAIPLDDTVILHNFTEEYVVNEKHSVLDPCGLFGHRLRTKLFVVTASVSATNRSLHCMHRAGIRPGICVLQSFAGALAALRAGERELGVVLIDFGVNTTNIAILSNGIPQYIARVNMGDEYNPGYRHDPSLHQ